MLYLWYSLIIAKIQTRISQRERCIGHGLEGSKYEASGSLRDALPSWHINIIDIQEPHLSQCPVFSGLSLCRHDWLKHCLCGSMFRPPTFPWGLADVRWLKSPIFYLLSGVTGPHLCHLFSISSLEAHHKSPY